MAFDVPVLLCVFNRPAQTRRVFEAIAKQKPSKLLIAGDGPRADRPEDVELIRQTQEIVQCVDWDCELETKFASTNRGCRQQMADAITWGFERHEQLVILEDDCVPNDSFFSFTREMLQRYADRSEVMMVSGNTYPTEGFGENSYRFSKYPLIWGWASWRRAWNRYDLNMTSWSNPETRQRVLSDYTTDPAERDYWKSIFDQQHAGKIDTWDYSWTYACWEASGVCIVPKKNLVSNIGFGSDATHTFDPSSPMANRRTDTLDVLKHPEAVERDLNADQQIREIVFEPVAALPPPKKKRWWKRLRDFARSAFSASVTSTHNKPKTGALQ